MNKSQAFTNPVNITVQYMDGADNAYLGLLDFYGVVSQEDKVRIVYAPF